MSLPIEVAGRKVADRLAKAEEFANESLHAHAALMQSMMDVRTQTDVTPYAGQIAVTRVQAAMNKIVEAQADLAKAHKQLKSDFCKITMIPEDRGRCPVGPSASVVQQAA